MANLNSENPHVGRKFQEFVQTILKEKYNTYFEQEAAIPHRQTAKGAQV